MKAKFAAIFGSLQRVGQSLMVPVSVLPAAGLLVALGRILGDQESQTGTLRNVFAKLMYSGGLAIFEQLPLVFAMGVAVGFTGGAGVAALAAAVGHMTLVNVLKVLSAYHPTLAAINTGVFGGILIGALAAWTYQRFHQQKLHPIFGFFSGKRLVPILTVGFSIFLAVGLGLVWPPIQQGIAEFGQAVTNSSWGPALYAAGKRALIPLGLHHVYYPPFLFEFGEFVNSAGTLVKGESARYFSGDPTAGQFMASEFPIMLFGLPMAAFAMYLRAKPTQRRAVGGMMLSAALTSIITGITEPIEFAFIFVAPLLYVVHIGLAFVSGSLIHLFDIHLGYTFSASLIDFGLGFFNQKNSWALWVIVGPALGALYFFSFYFAIAKFNFKTPGREEDISLSPEEKESLPPMVSKARPQLERIAREVLVLLGGVKNVRELNACITRLRVSTHEPIRATEGDFKKLGASGMFRSGSNYQIVFGVESDLLKEQMSVLIKEAQALAAEPPSFEFLIPIGGGNMTLEEVPDKVFSQKVLGEGFAIEPTEGVVRSPCAGEIMHIFPTGHAVAIKTPRGEEILIHVGIDTVTLGGQGFIAKVKTGDRVQSGQVLIEFDLEFVRKNAKSIVTPVVITNWSELHPKGLSVASKKFYIHYPLSGKSIEQGGLHAE